MIVLDLDGIDHLTQNSSKTFIPLRHDDLSRCRQISNKRMLCYPLRETHLFDDSSCESNILFNQNSENLLKTCKYKPIENKNWIISLSENQYFVSPANKILIMENCIHQHSKEIPLNETGIV